MKLNSITNTVKMFLENYPNTRDDDYLLWLRVLEFMAERDRKPNFAKSVSLGAFLSTAKCCKYPHYETVSRARRKLQEHYPSLRATAETEAARAKEEKLYREFARYGG